MRECGACTSCCDGTLEADIRGHKMKSGVPCFFVQIGKGCTDYENRPEDPCKNYSCLWIVDPDIPEWLKPEKTNVIIDMEDMNGYPHMRVIPKNKEDLTVDILSWAIVYANDKKINLSWKYGDIVRWIGSYQFCRIMENKHG